MSFSNLFDVISCSSSRKNRRGAEKAPKTRKLRLESLESREMLAVWVVDSLADPGVSGDNLTTLREAINLASANDVVNFHPDLIGESIELASTLNISKPLTIDGWNLPGEQSMPVDAFKGIMIDAKSLANATIINVGNGGSGSILRGLTITSSSPAGNIVESAIHANGNLSLSIENCVITNLTYSSKGVVNCNGNVLKITNTLIADNTSVFDGAAAVLYVKAASKATFYNCTVANNKTNASGTNFYGLYNDANVNVFVRNSIFTGHSTADFHAKQANGITLEYSVYEKLGNASAGTGAIPYVPANDVLYLDGANRNYWLAPGSIALDVGNADATVVNNNNGYYLHAVNHNRGYDLAGNYRLKGAATPYNVDAGAYSGGVIPQVIVTIETDGVNNDGEIDHSDDFYADGSPYRISLREAYDYIGKYYVSGNFNDFANSFKDADGTQNPGVVYDTIRFASGVENCRLAKEIVSEKTYTINGTNLGNVDVAVHGSKTLTSPGANIAATNAGRIFNVQSGTITANNLSLTNGFARSNDPAYAATYGMGGALYIASGAKYSAAGGEFYNNYAPESGGAIYIAAGGKFEINSVTIRDNFSSRGGGASNYGNFYVTTRDGNACFIDNMANGETFETIPGFDATKARGFGGGLYNAGNFQYIGHATSNVVFSGNSAVSDLVNENGVLLGGSGGAIYNTTRNGVDGSVTINDAVFDGNTASKYGGAISNFGTMTVAGAAFNTNTAATGGAIQNSNHANISDSSFTSNRAVGNISNPAESAFLLAPRSNEYGLDYGGNGGAIYACGITGSLWIGNNTTFTENTATNAGGAIDFINGMATFAGSTNIAFTDNSADVIGGAIVVASSAYSALNFGAGTTSATFSFSGNSTGYYAPTVAVATIVRDDVASLTAQKLFGTNTPAPQNLDAFVRYYATTSEHQMNFDALAESFATTPQTIHISVDDQPFRQLGRWETVTLAPGSRIVRYYADGNSNVMFRAHIQVVDDANTSVIVSQINLSEHAYISSNEYAAGVSLRVYSTTANPVKTWTIGWGDGTTTTIDNFGFALNLYHLYSAAGSYDLTLTTSDFAGASTPYGTVGFCVVPKASSAALLDAQDELFSDAALLDELFVEL